MSSFSIKFENKMDDFLKEFHKHSKAQRQAAAKFMAGKLKEAAPVGETGNLKRALKIKHWNTISGVGFSKGLGSHAHLVEKGHEIFNVHTKQTTGKRSKPNPFFETAWEANLSEMNNIIRQPVDWKG